MNKIDLFRLSFRNLWRRKFRTVLTILGVLIGTVSIVFMWSLGLGMKRSTDQMLERFGDMYNIDVYTQYSDRFFAVGVEDSSDRNSKSTVLNDQMISKIREIHHVSAVTPVITDLGHLIYKKNYEFFAEIKGIDMTTAEKFGYKLEDGTYPKHLKDDEIIIGQGVKENVYNQKHPDATVDFSKKDFVNQKVTLQSNHFTNLNEVNSGHLFEGNPAFSKIFRITALLEPSNNWMKENLALINLETAKKLKKEDLKAENKKSSTNLYNSAMVRVDHLDHIKDVQEEIKNLGFQAHSMIDEAESINDQTKIVQMVLLGIGSVAFIVATIGITNTMVMSIYERVKEIGVMKVIGASIPDIKAIFLIEAAYIGLIGGIIGSIICKIASHFANQLAANGMGDADIIISYMPLWLLVLGICLSTVIGLLAGYIPAVRATKISAIDAIRTE